MELLVRGTGGFWRNRSAKDEGNEMKREKSTEGKSGERLKREEKRRKEKDPPRFYRDRRIGQTDRPADRSGGESKRSYFVSSTQEPPYSLFFFWAFILADLFCLTLFLRSLPSGVTIDKQEFNTRKKGHRHRGRHKHTKKAVS